MTDKAWARVYGLPVVEGCSDDKEPCHDQT